MYRALSAPRRISACLRCPDPVNLIPNLLCAPSRAFHLSPLRPAAVPFVEKDLVLLRLTSDSSAQPILTKPLGPGTVIQTHKGALNHSDIIGKLPRDVVTSSSGATFRVHHVSLGDYVRLSKRLVTPIYPADANLIVSLLDLHVSPPPASSASTSSLSPPPMEILEAGTGHGALTLHLSRAIHAANPPQFTSIPSAQDVNPETAEHTETNLNSTEHDPIASWKTSRRAILHTIDVSPKYSKHARKIVHGFRHGVYAGNVDFHVGDVSDWVKQQFASRAAVSFDTGSPSELPFLTHAFLDLPATHVHLSTVASALHDDGILIIFNPSITQIAECLQKIKRESLPLFLEQTLELGQNGTSGGREWDVRVVKPRAATRKEEEIVVDHAASSEDVAGRDAEQERSDTANQPWSLVCRPKVGERVTGGGFLGVFRKMKDRSEERIS